jgi:hypothetical protein
MNPCADLTLGSAADVPMCEFWAKGYGFNTDFSCFEAVSIAHTLGRPIVAAESFTSDGERWVLHPGALKNQGDWAFCVGINRLVFHRFQHQPWLDRWPGLTMGSIGSHWERTQTWWELVPAYHEYLARCQFLLRQGHPVADICYLAPEGAPHVFRPPKSATRGNPPDRLAYSFDGCAPEVLRNQTTVRNRHLVTPGGMSYALLVLPKFETMTPELLTKVAELIQGGAVVLGKPPRKSPSLAGYPGCDEQVGATAARLWGSPALPERKVGNGRLFNLPASVADVATTEDIYPEYDLAVRVLSEIGVRPDFESEAPLRSTHRQDKAWDLYFVANPTDRVVETRAWFRVSNRDPELWEPITGEQRTLREFKAQDGRTLIPLRFEPYQSYFVAFPERVSGRISAPAGSSRPRLNFPTATELADVSGPWTIRFQTNRGAPAVLKLNELLDWTKHPDPGVQHFSGIATYQTEFEWPPKSTHSHSTLEQRVFLDLGSIQVMADVKLNEKELGTVWTAPFRVEATRALRPGTNTLQVRVANLWCNRLIADAGLPVEQRLTWTTWNPFKPESPLVSSGLLGPVRWLQME